MKYKRCHLNRESQEAPALWDARDEFNKIQRTKVCLHPQAGLGICGGPIVRAHTVRRAADLVTIARKGHVYQASSDLADLKRHNGRIRPKLVGVNEASTFFGFCTLHDAQTFAPLEQVALVPTDEQAFLLTYRPLAKELYLKERQLESTEIVRRVDKGRSLPEQARIQELVTLMRLGVETSLRDLRRHKQSFDRDLLAADFSGTRYVALHLDRAPDVMCSGIVQPHYTFDGHLIQDLGDLEQHLQAMSFSLAATTRGGIAVFAWRQDSDAASSELVDSLLRLTDSAIPDALVRYATSEFENTFFCPDWWEGLGERDREALLARLEHGVGPDTQPDPDYLRDDGRSTVDWQVTHVTQKRS